MRRLLYLAMLSMAAMLVFAPAALAQQQAPLDSAPIVGPGYPPACVDLLSENAPSIQAKAALKQKPSIAKYLDENNNGVACESTTSVANGTEYEDGSGVIPIYAADAPTPSFAQAASAARIGYSIDCRVGRYIRGPNATFGPHRRDQNNYVVEYAGTAGSSHRDGIIGVAVSRSNTPWGFNYFIVYDYQELNRLGYNYYGRAKLTRHERAHTRGWRHFEGNKRINQAYCNRINYNGTTPC